jgi:site-specific DNA recombinase
MLNQEIFHSLYVDDDQIADHSLREPFGQLHAVQQARHITDATVPEPRTDTQPQNANRAASQQGGGPAATNGIPGPTTRRCFGPVF